MKLIIKPNYLPWNLNSKDFPANESMETQVKFLLRYGLLAPSGHNGQPWKFKINNNELEIFIEPSRALVKSDPNSKQLCISIGCLIENYCQAADYFGYNFEINYLSDTSSKTPIAKIKIESTANANGNADHLLNFICQRSSNRNKFLLDPLPTDFFDKLQTLTNDDTQIFVSEEKDKNLKIADIIIESQIKAMENHYFREELSELMKPNFTDSKVGMPGFVFNLPLPISIIAPIMIRHLNMSKLDKKKDEDILKNHTPAFLLIANKSDDSLTLLKVGRLFEKIWLTAEKYGIKCSPNAAPIQDSDACKKLQSIFKTNLTPLAFFRVGFCNKNSGRTPRLSVEEVITKL